MSSTILGRRAFVLGSATIAGCAWQPRPQRFTGFGTIAEVTGLALGPNGNLLALSTLAGDIVLYDPSSLKPKSSKLAREGEALLGFDVSQESLVVVVASAEPTTSKTRGFERRSRVAVDDIASGQGGDVLSLDGKVTRMRVARFGKHAIFATEAGNISVVDLGTAATVASWSGVSPDAVAISGRGEQVAWATKAGVALGSPASAALRMLATKVAPSAIQFAERGRALYAVAGEELVRFDLETGEPEVFPLPGSASAFSAASNGSVAIANQRGFALLEGATRRDAEGTADSGDPPRFLAYDSATRRAFVASRAAVTAYDTEKMVEVGVVRNTLSDVPRING